MVMEVYVADEPVLSSVARLALEQAASLQWATFRTPLVPSE